MRHLLLATILSTALLLSHTAVQAQGRADNDPFADVPPAAAGNREKGLDEFEAFRNKLNANKGTASGGSAMSPDSEEEDADIRPLSEQKVSMGVDSRLVSNERAEKQLQAEKRQKEEAAAFEGMIVTDSEISAVTVYSDRAKVTRTARVEIPAGASIVALKNITPLLLAESLRADGSAVAPVTFGAVMHKKVKFTSSVSSKDLELYDKIEPLEDQLKFISAERAALQIKREFIARIGQTALEKTKEDFTRMELKSDQWSGAAQDIYKSYAEMMKTDVELDLKRRDVERQISNLKKDIGHSRPVERTTYAVIVPLETEKATSLTINVSYQVPYATWRPIYDARLETKEKGSLQIIQYGSVTQLTGEDWKDVTLTLSTAQPQRATSLPELQQVWVNAYDAKAYEAAARGGSSIPVPTAPGQNEQLSVPPVQKTLASDPLAEWRQKAEARRLSLESETAPPEAEPEPVPVQFSAAHLETGGFVSEYKISGPARVMSDKSESKLLVENFIADSEVQVHVKPQISTDAFLVAQMVLKGESPLLPGEMNLFRDGAYIGQTSIPLLPPGEDYSLYFGIDDQVKVKRNTLKDENKEEGMISKDSVLERQFVTELQNLHTTSVKIVVKESIPTSRNEKVVVTVDKLFTSPGFIADAKNVKGMMHWSFDLPPKDKKELKLGWTVTWPKDHRLTGL